MTPFTLVRSIVLAECHGGAPIKRVVVVAADADEWVWVFLITRRDCQRALSRDLLHLLSPLRVGAIISESASDEVLVCREDCVASRVNRTSVSLPTVGIEPDEAAVLVKIEMPRTPLDADDIARGLREGAWLGSRVLPSKLRERCIALHVGAQVRVLCPPTADPVWGGSHSGSLIGFFRTSASRSGKVGCSVLTSSGMRRFELEVVDIATAAGVMPEEIHGYVISPELECEIYWDGSEPSAEAVAATVTAFLRREQSPALLNEFRRGVRLARERSGAQVESRTRRMTERPRLRLREGTTTRDLGPRPTNEHETLILVGKLEEALQRHFGVFRLLEHTGQSGIDGLVSIRPEIGSPVETATVEFEYSLENFFTHGHPIQQTRYIVCWTLGRLTNQEAFRFGLKGVSPQGPMEARVDSVGWMKVLHFRTSALRVLPLELFPGLESVV